MLLLWFTYPAISLIRQGLAPLTSDNWVAMITWRIVQAWSSANLNSLLRSDVEKVGTFKHFTCSSTELHMPKNVQYRLLGNLLVFGITSYTLLWMILFSSCFPCMEYTISPHWVLVIQSWSQWIKPLLSKQSFYRQIAGCWMGVGDHRVGQWWKKSWANKIVVRC